MNRKQKLAIIGSAGLLAFGAGAVAAQENDPQNEATKAQRDAMNKAEPRNPADPVNPADPRNPTAQRNPADPRNDTTKRNTAGQYDDNSDMRDAWLDGKLETALLFNTSLNSFDIDTDVKNGVAILDGAVESELDRELAGLIAESIEGVERVDNKLTVDKTKAGTFKDTAEYKERSKFTKGVTDATLTARVKSELMRNDQTSALEIDVDSKDGVVTLSGKVDSTREKELAAEIARNADGAKSIENRITVTS